MQIIIQYDTVTKETAVNEENCTEEFIYSALATYLGTKCRDEMPDKESALARLEGVTKIASEIIKEKYNKPQRKKRK